MPWTQSFALPTSSFARRLKLNSVTKAGSTSISESESYKSSLRVLDQNQPHTRILRSQNPTPHVSWYRPVLLGELKGQRCYTSVAVEQGDVEVARFLVSKGFCRVDCTDKQGRTPLDLVLRRGDIQMLQAFGNVDAWSATLRPIHNKSFECCFNKYLVLAFCDICIHLVSYILAARMFLTTPSSSRCLGRHSRFTCASL